MIKSIFITVLLLMTCLLTQAQSFMADYDYDANGNRISVTVIYLSIKSSSSNIDEIIPEDADTVNLPRQGWTPELADSSKNYSVIIYPNPTYGKLLIRINNIAAEKLTTAGNAIKVWNMQGKLLLEKAQLGTYNLIDLSQYASGNYVLKVYLNEVVKDYKIVKE